MKYFQMSEKKTPGAQRLSELVVYKEKNGQNT